MSPSDMILQIGTIVGYNNKIVIATENQTLGFNSDVNVKPVAPTTQPATIQGTPTKKSLPEPNKGTSNKEISTRTCNYTRHTNKEISTRTPNKG